MDKNSSLGLRPKTPHTPAAAPITSSGLLARRTGHKSSERRKRLGNSFPADNTVSLPRRQTHVRNRFIPSAALRRCGSLESKCSASRANTYSSRGAVHAGEEQRDATQRADSGRSTAPACRALVGARASDDQSRDGSSMLPRDLHDMLNPFETPDRNPFSLHTKSRFSFSESETVFRCSDRS